MAADKSQWVVGQVLSRQAERGGERPFVQFRDGAPVTYAEAHRLANRVARGLAGLGVGRGERVGVMLPNSLEYLWAWLGIVRLGAVAVTVNTAYRGAFLEHVLNDAGVRVLVIHPDYLEWLAEIEAAVPALATAVVPGGEGAEPGFERIALRPYRALLAPSDADLDVAVTYRDVGTIMYTSGTTGPSKGVLMTHGHMYLLGESARVHLQVGSDDVCYQCMPLFHGMGMFLQLLCTMLAGAQAVMVPVFSATSWSEDVRRYRATWSSTLGVMTEFILRQPPRPEDADNRLRALFAVPVTAEIVRQFRERFRVEKLIEGFGMTECGMPLWFPYNDPPRPGSCGKVWDRYYEVKIVDPETDEDVPAGEIGEIVIRPREPFCFMSGYNADPEKTVGAWRNFWFHSGDAGRVDADGYFWYVDRIKDAIRRRGENISSYEVEFVLAQHPAVAEAAAVAVPSEVPGGEDEVLACLVLVPGAEPPAPEAILDFCVPRMPYFAVPRFVEFLDALPKTPSQKVRKARLRDPSRPHARWDREAAGYRVTRPERRAARG